MDNRWIRFDPEEHGPAWNPITGDRPFTDDITPQFTGLLAMFENIEAAPLEKPGDMLARMQEMARALPEPPQAARIEVGQTVLDWLKATAQHEGPEPQDAWRPVGWIPPPGGAVFGVPVVLNEELGPSAWRAIDHDGQVISEGLCP